MHPNSPEFSVKYALVWYLDFDICKSELEEVSGNSGNQPGCIYYR